MAIEIVSFPINSMVIFHSYGTVYQRVSLAASMGVGAEPGCFFETFSQIFFVWYKAGI